MAWVPEGWLSPGAIVGNAARTTPYLVSLPPFHERRKSRDLDHLWPQDLHSQYLTATLRPRWLKRRTLCMAMHRMAQTIVSANLLSDRWRGLGMQHETFASIQ